MTRTSSSMKVGSSFYKCVAIIVTQCSLVVLKAEMLKPRGQNVGLGLGLVTSGLGLWTLCPQPQAFGLGLDV